MTKRILVIMAAFLLFTGLLYGGFAVYIELILPGQVSSTESFQAYAPTTLPDGVHATSHLTQVFMDFSTKNVDINTNIPEFYISENIASASERTGVYSCGSNIQPTSCNMYTAPDGQKYQVLISEDETGKPSLDTISWVRGKTLVVISLEDSAAQHYASTNWNKTVDGFVPANYGFERGSIVRNMGV